MAGIAGCNCNGQIGNTGFPNVKPFGLTSGVFLMPILASDGTRNGFDLTSATLPADLLAAINNPDPSKRLYPFSNLRNVTHNEADPNYETADNGERFKTRDGVKTVTFECWGVNEQFYAKVADNCVNFGVYLVDVCGNLKGQKEGTDLYPRPVNRYSYDAKFMDATADTGTKVMIQMDYSLLTNDGDQWMIPADLFAPYSALELNGMIDVNLDITVEDDTTLIVKATFDYGNAVVQLPWTGAVVGDFTAKNVTTGLNITIASVTESTTTPGTYTLTIPAQANGDACTLKAFHAATGNMLFGFESEVTAFVAQ